MKDINCICTEIAAELNFECKYGCLFLISDSREQQHTALLLRAVPRNHNGRYNSASDYTDSVGLLVKKGS
jgi:hypothetical protein